LRRSHSRRCAFFDRLQRRRVGPLPHYFTRHSPTRSGRGMVMNSSFSGAPASSCLTRARVTVYQLDPLRDRRWANLLESNPRASVFHTSGWLEALRRTYGYEPVAYTTTPPGIRLTNAVVLSRVYSRITGRRLVSLPFSDHCEPLVDQPEDLKTL